MQRKIENKQKTKYIGFYKLTWSILLGGAAAVFCHALLLTYIWFGTSLERAWFLTHPRGVAEHLFLSASLVLAIALLVEKCMREDGK